MLVLRWSPSQGKPGADKRGRWNNVVAISPKGLAMAKKKSAKKATTKKLPKLTPLASQIVLYLVNNLAIGDYDRCCAIEDIAKHLGKSEGRIKKLIEQLVEQGYLQVEGGMLETAYPTVAAIQRQDPSVSAEKARELIRGAKN